MISVRQYLHDCEQQLREAGVVTPKAEAEWLLSASLGVSRTEVYLRQEPLKMEETARLEERLARRCGGESLQYVLGETECLGHRLRVKPGVFIPRPETEVLIEEAISFLQARLRQGLEQPRVLELGVGSGAIAIALARAVPACVIIGVELSWMALSAAVSNSAANGVRRRVRLVQGDWTRAVQGRFDLVISNPPYVPSEEVDQLLRRGQDDPRMSLDGGPAGVSFHHRLVEDAPRLVAEGGALCMECAEDQADALRHQLLHYEWIETVSIIKDLAQRPRGVWAVRSL